MISVIIPTLNEASFLPATIARLKASATPSEILVVDGGSRDATIQSAESAGCRVVASSERHRARQMNLGAHEASGEALFFLHADTMVAPGALQRIERVLDDPSVVGGAFARRFAHPSRLLRITCLLADYRGRWLGWFLGDQGIFVRRNVFDAMGGFREMPLFEDLDFSRRLSRLGRVVLLRPPVLSSPRRFAARGPLITTCEDFWLTCRYLCGTDANRLARERPDRFRTESNPERVGASHS